MNMSPDQIFGLLFGISFLVAIILTWISVSQKIGQAAFRKGRSYKSFFWLSLLVSPILMGIILAALPFDPQDPRSPQGIFASNPDLARYYAGSETTGVAKAAIVFAIAAPILLVIGVVLALA